MNTGEQLTFHLALLFRKAMARHPDPLLPKRNPSQVLSVIDLCMKPIQYRAMSRSFPFASLLLLAPLAVGLSACDTVYSKTYSYQKTQFAVVTLKDGTRVLQKSYVFQPHEQLAKMNAEANKQQQEVDRLRMAAQKSQKTSADMIGSDAGGLRMDSGLTSGGASLSSPLGMGGSSSIPGLDAPAAAPSMSGGIPGMDSPSMSGSMAPSMSGSSMEGATMTAPATAPKPAPSMLPGL